MTIRNPGSKIQNAFRGFTLIELLVVVTIIIVLLALLGPAMNGAINMAQRAKCQSVMRQTAMANADYAIDHVQTYVYTSWGGGTYDGVNYTKFWATDPNFLQRVGLSVPEVANKWKTNTGGYGGGFGAGVQWPEKFDCPSERDGKYWLQNQHWGHEIGVAYTRGEIGVGQDVKVSSVRQTGVKFQFADGDNWWMSAWGSDYRRWFDLGVIDHGGWGGMIPRHDDGANIAFYDLHVDWLHKEQTFFYTTATGASPDHTANRKVWDVRY